MSKNRFGLMFVLLLVLALALAACGGAAAPAAQSTATTAPADTGTTGTGTTDTGTTDTGTAAGGVTGEVTLWHAYGTQSAEERTLAVLIENARQEFPGLTINVLQIPFDQIFNRYLTEVAAGGGPDMFVAPNDDLGNWVRSGSVLPLDSQLAGRLNNVEEVAIEGMRVDGQIYGVPESAKAVALYYNRSLVPEAPQTMDELLDFVREAGDQSIVLNQNAYHSFPFFTAFGGELMDDTGRCTADQGGFAEALQYMKDLKDAGAIFETDGGRADTLFRNGQVAMIINGPWTLGDYRESLGDDLGVAPVPTGTAPAAAFNGIDGFYINPNSQNVDAAIEVALFLTNQASSTIYTEQAGHVPIRSDVTATDERVAGFAAASAQGFPRPQSEQFGNYWGPFGDAVTKVLEGVSEPEAAVQEACASMNEASGY